MLCAGGTGAACDVLQSQQIDIKKKPEPFDSSLFGLGKGVRFDKKDGSFVVGAFRA